MIFGKDQAMQTTRPVAHSRHAFTLIEMLATMAIILVLAGILLRMMATFDQERRVKQAVAEMEALRNALNEYFIEYGHYPPTDIMEYEYENTSNQHVNFRDWLGDKNVHTNPVNFFPDMVRSDTNEPVHSTKYPRESLGYQYGLVSYLWPRDMGGKTQVHWYDQDTARDKAAKARWAPYLSNISLAEEPSPPRVSGPGMMTTVWTNTVRTVNDPWGREYRYESKPPFQRYRLWSKGPDRHDGTADDIARDSFNE
jgi:prepilin-type N-terminal cleavage/methylation domain-containing protein